MGGRRRWFAAAAAASCLGLAIPLPSQDAGAAPAPPSLFGIRLEGYAVRENTFTTASAANPSSGYSFAKIDSNPGYDGGRQLEMKVVATNNDPGDLGGAVVFSADSPFNGSNLPGYADAYFPTFEGYSQLSEKCGANVSNREAPECRDQPGPYALAQVVPDEASPHVLALARSSGSDEAGQTTTRAEIGIDEDGAVVALQDNRGNNQQVPGTPIVVDFVASTSIVATVDGVEATGNCTANVTVAGQPAASDEQLQQLLAPFTASSGVRVAYEPPTAPAVVETGDGGREVSCTGAQFTVSAPVQGESGETYTYGRSFAASSQPDNPTYGAAPSTPTTTPTVGGGSTPVTSGVTNRPSPIGTLQGPVPTTTMPQGSPTTASQSSPPSAPRTDTVPSLIARRLDTLPLGAWTAVAATVLPVGVWLLLGVTGSLARGLPRLRLPPFPVR